MDEPIASVFVSYAHDDKSVAREISASLQARGCRVWVDEGELRVGDSLIQSISEALDRVDFVAVIVSKSSLDSEWCRKEVSIAMTGEINRLGVIVLPLRLNGTPMPPTLRDKLYLDVDSGNVDGAIDQLMGNIRRHLEPSAPLPARRRAPVKPASRQRIAASRPLVDETEPIKITGIDEANIGQPRNDGSRGSALYSVPLVLSRVPSAAWAQQLPENWDHPHSWTTMHRPGIARVSGNRIILDGTTIDEVAKYHLATLKGAVEVTNQQVAAAAERERALAAATAKADKERRQQAREAIERLNFD